LVKGKAEALDVYELHSVKPSGTPPDG
jgi:hypothetical protein